MKCGRCGAKVPKGAVICPGCGEDVSTTAGQEEPLARPSAPAGISPTRPLPRPLDVIVLMVLFITSGAFLLGLMGWISLTGDFSDNGGIGLVCVIPLLVLGILELTIWIGLQKMESWAWKTAVLIAFFSFIIVIILLIILSTLPGQADKDPAVELIESRYYFMVSMVVVLVVLHVLEFAFLYKGKQHFFLEKARASSVAYIAK